MPNRVHFARVFRWKYIFFAQRCRFALSVVALLLCSMFITGLVVRREEQYVGFDGGWAMVQALV